MKNAVKIQNNNSKYFLGTIVIKIVYIIKVSTLNNCYKIDLAELVFYFDFSQSQFKCSILLSAMIYRLNI